jgi:undecaprenyl pyrophosphate phosphatase UppP
MILTNYFLTKMYSIMRKGSLVTIVGGLAAIIAVFLPFVELLGTTVSLWEGGVNPSAKGVVYVVLITAAAMALFGYLANKKHLFAIGSLIAALMILGMCAIWLTDEEHKKFLTTGVYVLTAGGAIGLVGAIMSFMKK